MAASPTACRWHRPPSHSAGLCGSQPCRNMCVPPGGSSLLPSDSWDQRTCGYKWRHILKTNLCIQLMQEIKKTRQVVWNMAVGLTLCSTREPSAGSEGTNQTLQLRVESTQYCSENGHSTDRWMLSIGLSWPFYFLHLVWNLTWTGSTCRMSQASGANHTHIHTHIKECHLWVVFPMAEECQVPGTVHQLQRCGDLIVGKAVQCQVSLK